MENHILIAFWQWVALKDALFSDFALKSDLALLSKNFKLHFFKNGSTDFFEILDLSCPLSTIKKLVKSFSWFLPYFLNTSECFIYSWDILFHCNSFGNQVEKRPYGIFPHGKMLSLEKGFFRVENGIFPHGKKLSLEKGLFPLEIQVDCSGRPNCKKVLLQQLPETFWHEWC